MKSTPSFTTRTFPKLTQSVVKVQSEDRKRKYTEDEDDIEDEDEMEVDQTTNETFGSLSFKKATKAIRPSSQIAKKKGPAGKG